MKGCLKSNFTRAGARISLLFAALLLPAGNCTAVTMIVGDIDGFGFPSASVPSLVAYNGWAADRDGNGMLNGNDLFPDLDNDGFVQAMPAGMGDVFDHRSAGEIADDYAKWTDVALSNDYSSAPGNSDWKADEVIFRFNFAVPNPGDPDYGVAHIVSLVYCDYDTGVMTAKVEGATWPLLTNADGGGHDGYIHKVSGYVSWCDMLDGQVTIDISAPSEPYIVFDYASLQVPEPATISLLALGCVAFRRRRR